MHDVNVLQKLHDYAKLSTVPASKLSPHVKQLHLIFKYYNFNRQLLDKHTRLAVCYATHYTMQSTVIIIKSNNYYLWSL